MPEYKIIEVSGSRGVNRFMKIGYDLYKDDENFVPPIWFQLKSKLMGKNNALLDNGVHAFFVAVKNGNDVGRILVATDEVVNKRSGENIGHISLFECINYKDVAFALFDKAFDWHKQQGMEKIIGPGSPSNGDDYRGILYKGFDGPPVLLNVYSPEYYVNFFVDYGFKKYNDLYAYYFDSSSIPEERFGRVVKYAMKRYEFRVDKFNMKNKLQEFNDIRQIMVEAIPNTESWRHFPIPSDEDVQKIAKFLLPFADADFVHIARTNEGRPIGFVVALPDYNQVQIHLKNGRIFPFGIFKYFKYKKKINGIRIFIQFVIPEFQNKAVNSAIFYQLMVLSHKKGIIKGEGSTMNEANVQSIRSVEGAGGKRYRIYRRYIKDV